MIIIECPNCHARYQYDEQRFDGKPSKKIKCAKCAAVFEIHSPLHAPAPPVAAAAAASGEEEGERTFTRRDEPKRPAQSTEQSPLPQRPAGRIAADLHLPAGKRISLAVIDGPDAGTLFRMEKPRVTVGRSNADLTLNDTEASRQHAAVEVRDAVILLQDLGSTNGTLVNGERIAGSLELQDKSEFQIGATTIMLIVTESPES